METIDLYIRLWLRKYGIPEKIYRNLPPYYKGILHKLICPPGGLTSTRERRDLCPRLFSSTGIGGTARDSIVPFEHMTDEEIEKVFLPVTPDDLHEYLSRF